MAEKKTTMSVSGDVWETINRSRKVGESFSDALGRLLSGLDSFEELKRQVSKLTEEQKKLLATMFMSGTLIDELVKLEAK